MCARARFLIRSLKGLHFVKQESPVKLSGLVAKKKKKKKIHVLRILNLYEMLSCCYSHLEKKRCVLLKEQVVYVAGRQAIQRAAKRRFFLKAFPCSTHSKNPLSLDCSEEKKRMSIQRPITLRRELMSYNSSRAYQLLNFFFFFI